MGIAGLPTQFMKKRNLDEIGENMEEPVPRKRRKLSQESAHIKIFQSPIKTGVSFDEATKFVEKDNYVISLKDKHRGGSTNLTKWCMFPHCKKRKVKCEFVSINSIV